MFTILILEGRIPKYCIGMFKTTAEAEAWAKADGWKAEQYKVIQLYP